MSAEEWEQMEKDGKEIAATASSCSLSNRPKKKKEGQASTSSSVKEATISENGSDDDTSATTATSTTSTASAVAAMSGNATVTAAATAAVSSSSSSSKAHGSATKDNTNTNADYGACPLPEASGPPPPPPNVPYIYHLCQTSKWNEAVSKQMPYFPPTYVKDGKFTRATVHAKDLVDTANTYYQAIDGDFMVLEINTTILYQMGVAIFSQDAPENYMATNKKNKNAVKCLQLFGGISTTMPGLIANTYKMKRHPTTGKFLSMSTVPDKTTEIEDDTNDEENGNTAEKRNTKNNGNETKSTTTTGRRRFWKMFR